MARQPLAVQAWVRGWRTFGVAHRYTATGMEHLLSGGAKLIVGYHGRPLAWDLCILSAHLHGRLGYLPHGIVHGSFTVGPLAQLTRDLGFVAADGPELVAAVARGEHVLVAPGGTREGCRSITERYQVDWGDRTGYLRLALRYGLPIVPVAALGVDDLYLGLNDGAAWGKRLRIPARLPLWLGVGPLGPFPFSPPFPVAIRQAIGAPLDVRALVGDDGQPDGLLRAHRAVKAAVQQQLDGLRRSATA